MSTRPAWTCATRGRSTRYNAKNASKKRRFGDLPPFFAGVAPDVLDRLTRPPAPVHLPLYGAAGVEQRARTHDAQLAAVAAYAHTGALGQFVRGNEVMQQVMLLATSFQFAEMLQNGILTPSNCVNFLPVGLDTTFKLGPCFPAPCGAVVRTC